MDMVMDTDAIDGTVSIKGSAPNSTVAFRGESGPVTIEIENLDPGTTAEDVKVMIWTRIWILALHVEGRFVSFRLAAYAPFSIVS